MYVVLCLFCELGSIVQSVSHVQLFMTPWTAAHQASLFSIISQSLLKLMYIEPMRLYNHLVLCCPRLLLPSIFSSIRVFSNESALHMRWPKYWSFSLSSASVPPMNIQDWFPFGLPGLISLQFYGFSSFIFQCISLKREKLLCVFWMMTLMSPVLMARYSCTRFGYSKLMDSQMSLEHMRLWLSNLYFMFYRKRKRADGRLK